MKIGFLTPEYPHEKTGNSGGLGTSIKNLAHALTALGHEVVILVYEQNQDAIFFDNAVEVHQIKNIKIKGLSWYLTRKKLEGIINSLYDKNKIEIIEAPDWTGITSFIKPKKCPIIIRLHGSDTYFCHLDNRPVKWINKFHEKRALQNADGHISVSAYTAQMTNEIFKQKNRFTIIHNGIDMNLFQNNAVNTSVNSNVVLYFGTLIRKKGLLELPLIFNKIVAQRPQTQLVLVGRDSSDILSGNASTWTMMQKLFTPEALQQVRYLGGVPYEEMCQHIAAASVCVFPTFAEALPVSWLEAMTMQKAIVASNIGWGPEVIQTGVDGVLVSPKDHQAYADAVLEVLENESQNTIFGKNAAQKVQTVFANSLIAEKSLGFYKQYIKRV